MLSIHSHILAHRRSISVKRTVEPKVLYFGTPVVLISSRNPDGTTNLGPMSSAWWLGYTAMLGMGTSAQTVKNLAERPEGVLNLVDPSMVAALDRIALLTGSKEMSEAKRLEDAADADGSCLRQLISSAPARRTPPYAGSGGG